MLQVLLPRLLQIRAPLETHAAQRQRPSSRQASSCWKRRLRWQVQAQQVVRQGPNSTVQQTLVQLVEAGLVEALVADQQALARQQPQHLQVEREQRGQARAQVLVQAEAAARPQRPYGS